MRRIALAASISVIASVTALAAEKDDKWIKMSTANFELYTPQGERKARETVLYFEQLREFFETTWKVKPDAAIATRIVLFGSEKQYKPFSPNEVAAGYFQSSVDRDWIVLGPVASEGRDHMITHEYVHLMEKQAGLKLPIWLNEGIAEVYSTFKPVGGKVTIADLIPSHFYVIQQSKWIPLSRLLAVDHDSPEYNKKAHAGALYAESWALTHMLMLSKAYRDSWGAITQNIINGTQNSQEAIEKATGKSIKDVDRDLQAYVRGRDTFFAAIFPFKSQRSQNKLPGVQIASAEAESVLVGLLSSIRKNDAAKERAAKLVESAGSEWRTHEALAYMAFRENKFPEASGHFAKAIDLGASSPKTFYDAARTFMYSSKVDERAPVYLNKAIELFPEWTEARLQLIEHFIYARKPEAALAVIAKFKKIDPKNASRLFRGKAWAELMKGNDEVAAAEAVAAAKWAKTEFDEKEVKRLSDFLDRKAKMLAASKARTAESGDATERLVAEAVAGSVRRSDEDTLAEGVRVFQLVGDQEPKLFAGTLVDLACSGQQAVLKLQDDTGAPFSFEILDPSLVNIQLVKPGQTAETMELTCGPQKKKVKLAYVQSGETKTGGLVRKLEFLE